MTRLCALMLLPVLACGDKDAGSEGTTGDGGTTSADGGADGGASDGGASDGGSSDGGTADGGTSDGGTSDGGSPGVDGDMDADGLSDEDETTTHGTDPNDRDSDGDGQTDAAELAGGSDPLSAASIIDGIYAELDVGESEDASQAIELKVMLGDLALVIDTSAGMESLTQALGDELSGLESDLSPWIVDSAWGYATYEDYAYGTMGWEGADLPFRVEQEVASGSATVQSLLTATPMRSGGDAPASTMEALFQAASGAGYDQDCDGVYDSNTDVLPYLASATGPFGGTAGQAATSSSLGDAGGLGFRDLSLRLLIFGTDAQLRDPAVGFDAPGGCPGDAERNDVVSSVAVLGAYVVGICLEAPCVDQATEIASATGSYADVVTWSGSDPSDLREALADRLETLLEAIEFERIGLSISGDDAGFISDWTMTGGAGIGDSATLELSLEGRLVNDDVDQVVVIELGVVGDESILLAETQLIIVVPGTARE